jgi:hypothetical protein
MAEDHSILSESLSHSSPVGRGRGMNRLDTQDKSPGGSAAPSTATTRLSGVFLPLARVVWLALVLPSIGFFVSSLPAYYQQLQRGCVDPLTCFIAGALPPQVLHSLTASGFSASMYAAVLTVFFVLIEAIWYAVGFLLFWRRSDDWLALLAALFLVLFNGPLTLPSPALALPFGFVSFLRNASLAMFLVLFPNGRLVPRWMGAILLLDFIYQFVDNLPTQGSSFDTNWPGWLSLLVNLVINGAIIYSQIYRYRHVSTPVQRQQTKWVVLGVIAAGIFYLGLLAIGFFIPSLANTLFFRGVWGFLFPVVLLLIPFSIGFSILRYRLYDIDVLINRTLVYGSLTALLALLYFGLIVALQSLFQGVFHQSNAVAIVVSTLVIAALFQPLRHRIQALIDRRFYRRKYDAARTLAAFSATLRNEVDLASLSKHLVAVVEETMQPTFVSLWLRPPASRSLHQAPWSTTPADPSKHEAREEW